MPIILTWVSGLLEAQPWTAIIAYCSVATGGGAALAYFGVKLIERVSSHFSTKATQDRIAGQIKEYSNSGHTMIDTVTAAGIWEGTLDLASLDRHLKFRALKAAIDEGEISVAVLTEKMKKANKDTKIPIDEFSRYLKERGALP